VGLTGLIGFIPLADLMAGVVASLVFGVIGVALLLLGYWLFDLITPKIDVQKELCEKNVAVAIVVAALLLGIAYLVAQVVAS
jgi:putative membrane protein